MKKNILHTAILYTARLSLLTSLNAYAMGLGDLKVNSYLDQTFNADIELIDVGSTPLAGIEASLASLQEFERLGLERAYALTLLTFHVEKHANGKPFIKVLSVEKITEPYMQLLVDLVWATGQVNRVYTILLDPPNYQLSMAHKQVTIVKRQYGLSSTKHYTSARNSIDTNGYKEREASDIEQASRGVVSYGPTLANETIWQIAQHYKAGETTLQQIILGIVGMNPQAFTEGNLNGLKVGSRLKIPANSSLNNVPAAAAKLEVLAHDNAWQARKPIEHVLLPPYISATSSPTINPSDSMPTDVLSYTSEIAAIPKSSTMSVTQNDTSSRYLPLTSSLLSIAAEVAPAAIDSVRATNALLAEQIRNLQNDKQRLVQKLQESEQELKRLREKVQSLLTRKGILGQTSQQSLEAEQPIFWPWVLLVFVLGMGGFAYWWFWIRSKLISSGKSEASASSPVLEPSPAIVEDQHLVQPAEISVMPEIEEQKLEPESEPQPELGAGAVELKPDMDLKSEEELQSEPEPMLIEEEKPIASPIEMVEEPAALPEMPKPEEISDEENKAVDDHIFEYEPELTTTSEPSAPIEESKQEKIAEEKEDNSIDFVLNPVEEPVSASPEEDIKPVKSKAALETLLGLAKTYIGMDDFEAAKQSLQEVLEFGDEAQKLEAQRMIDGLDKK